MIVIKCIVCNRLCSSALSGSLIIHEVTPEAIQKPQLQSLFDAPVTWMTEKLHYLLKMRLFCHFLSLQDLVLNITTKEERLIMVSVQPTSNNNGFQCITCCRLLQTSHWGDDIYVKFVWFAAKQKKKWKAPLLHFWQSLVMTSIHCRNMCHTLERHLKTYL